MAEAVARAGATVALLDVRDEVHDAAEQLSVATGAGVVGVVADVTDEASVDAALDQVADRLGVPEALVHAAGVADTTSALDITPERFRQIVDINLTGTFVVCRAFARRLIVAGQSGSAVTIASMSSLRVNRPQDQAAYNASKAGVAMLTKSLAVEWLPLGIRLNAISPGYFASEQTLAVPRDAPEQFAQWMAHTPVGRMGEPHELGPLAVYLLSDASAYVVGQSIVIDGGYTAL
ncbi:SDR family oxidoreductase [Mycobacterium yunnanensis]|uniref:SDR family oxidoreductase n=2 Tax=Mycobacterium yunnanensis TaxID=368477 RepID=A0A9X2Z9D1_9MYCO|nr:SDR family oxidoreductase [Mycobacterium yunnanensis]